jgi:hypothetical protein
MNNWCIGWFFMHIFKGILIFKGLTGLRLYKSFGVKGLIYFRDIRSCLRLGYRAVTVFVSSPGAAATLSVRLYSGDVNVTH